VRAEGDAVQIHSKPEEMEAGIYVYLKRPKLTDYERLTEGSRIVEVSFEPKDVLGARTRYRQTNLDRLCASPTYKSRYAVACVEKVKVVS